MKHPQPDLFAPPPALPDGFKYEAELITPEEEQAW